MSFARVRWLAVLVCLTAAWTGWPGEPPAAPRETVAEQIVHLTGARTKLVWERALGGKGHFGGDRPDYRLMVFDTKEGKERELCPGPGSYAMPQLTPDGKRVMFSDTVNNKVCIVDWDGKNRKVLLDGYWGCDLIPDAATGGVWVYAAEADAFPKQKALIRFRLSDPNVREVVWNVTPGHNRVTISPDGTLAAGEFPWPKCCLATLPNVDFALIGEGCCADLAPDGSGRFFHMLGDHRMIVMFDPGGRTPHMVNVGRVPGYTRTSEVWYPYWTNDARFLTVVGPFAKGINEYCPSNLNIGRFNASFSEVTEWVQVTKSTELETMASAWIEPFRSVLPQGPGVWPGYLKRHEELVARAHQGGVDVLCLGDSLFARWDEANWKANLAPLRAANFGITGDRVEHLLWRLENGELGGLNPKVVVLLAGINNVVQPRPADGNGSAEEEVPGGIKAILDLLAVKLPRTKVLLLALLPTGGPDDAPRQVARKINEVLLRLDDGVRVRYMDLGPQFVDKDGVISADSMPDYLHPSPMGYELWAKAMLPRLKNLLEAQADGPIGP